MTRQPPRGRGIRSALTLAAAVCCALGPDTAVAADGETFLQPGFPLYTHSQSGTHQAGPSGDNVLLGNVDFDVEPEIFVSSTATGPLFAWNGDGSPVPGWPVRDVDGFAYAGLGDLASDSPGLDVFVGSWWGNKIGPRLAAYSGEGRTLPGWPLTTPGAATTVPATADIDGDGLDEVFIQDGRGDLSAYRHDGTLLPGWPVDTLALNDFTTPAIDDLDGDGKLEIVASADGTIYAWNTNGTAQAGFPVSVSERAPANTYPVIGDVDGDGQLEIVVVTRERRLQALVPIVSSSGSVERILRPDDIVGWGAAPALADLTGDEVPEIVVQTASQVNAWEGDGSAVPGWPVDDDVHSTHASPVVGDVDGDALPDVVVPSLSATSSSEVAQLRVYSADGSLKQGFPWTLPIRNPGVPGIGDVDADGRNEILVRGTSSSFTGYDAGMLAYDLGGGPHGAVEWGQFAGGPRHEGSYEAEHASRPLPEPEATSAEGPARMVADLAPGPAGSAPRDPEPFLKRVFFQAEDPESGAELWASNGTASGTHRVADVHPGAGDSSPRELTPVARTLFFVADDGQHGAELWKTNGSASGTALVRDIWPGSKGSSPRNLLAVGGTLYFSAWDGQHGYELWRSDGTAAGTYMVTDLLVGSGATPHGEGAGSDPMDLTVRKGDLYFRAFTVEPYEGAYTLWRLRAGKDLPEPLSWFGWPFKPWEPTQIVVSAGRLWLSGGRNVALLHGDQAIAHFDGQSETHLSRLVPFRGGLLYGALDGRYAAWHLPGPRATPRRLAAELRPAGRGMAPGYVAVAGDRAFLSAANTTSGTELWATDGTTQGTRLIADLRSGRDSSAPALLTALEDTIVFTADAGANGRELWTSDGSGGGTVLLQDLAPGPRGSNVAWIARVGRHVYFSANDGSHGQELWAMPVDLLARP